MGTVAPSWANSPAADRVARQTKAYSRGGSQAGRGMPVREGRGRCRGRQAHAVEPAEHQHHRRRSRPGDAVTPRSTSSKVSGPPDYVLSRTDGGTHLVQRRHRLVVATLAAQHSAGTALHPAARRRDSRLSAPTTNPAPCLPSTTPTKPAASPAQPVECRDAIRSGSSAPCGRVVAAYVICSVYS